VDAKGVGTGISGVLVLVGMVTTGAGGVEMDVVTAMVELTGAAEEETTGAAEEETTGAAEETEEAGAVVAGAGGL
jgi:hypothetical protein